MDLFDYIDDDFEDDVVSTDEVMAPPLLTVSQLSNTLKSTVEALFAEVRVEGEVSRVARPASGHLYFDLKDKNAVINAIVWKGAAARLTHLPQEGQQVVAHGRLTTYAQRSTYQIIIDKLEPAGEGALLAQLEALKKKLAAEGLFDAENKRPLPYLPRKIGIITSPSGAVIEDMLHRVTDRCPRHIMLCGVAVQGAAAAGEIVAAIETFNALPEAERPDVLIIARGGGSLEDLMAFNDEAVVRAVAASEIITISGVGHEPDTTLCDYAADVRAPTPSAAAELAVPVRDDLLRALEAYTERLPAALRGRVVRMKERLTLMARTLEDPRREVTQRRMILEDKAERLLRVVPQLIGQKRELIAARADVLAQLSPSAPLARGYLYATNSAGYILRSAKTKDTTATLHFADGVREAALK